MSISDFTFAEIVTQHAEQKPDSPAIFTCVPRTEEDPDANPTDLKAVR